MSDGDSENKKINSNKYLFMTYFKQELDDEILSNHFEIIPYTKLENLFYDLEKNKVAYIENAFDIEKFYDIATAESRACGVNGSCTTVPEYSSDLFKNTEKYISHTLFYDKLSTLGNLELINIVTRCKNLCEGTGIHLDSHTLLHMYHNVKYLNFWAPTTDINLDQGSLFFIKQTGNKDFKNILKKQAFYQKLALTKAPVADFYKSSSKFLMWFPELVIKLQDIKKYELRILTKPLKKNDLIIFYNNTFHGAFDSLNYVRNSIDFRISINMKKIHMPELKNLEIEQPQTNVNSFDNQVLEKLLF